MATYLNFLNGPLKVYVADYPATNGDPWDANAADWGTEWTLLSGYQYVDENGLVLNIEDERADWVADNWTAPVRRDIVGESVGVELNLLKGTLLEWANYAINGATVTEGSVAGTNPNTITKGGALTSTELALGLQGLDESGNVVVVYLPRCTAGESNSTNFKKKGPTSIPLRFDSLADTTQSAGEDLIKIWQATVA